MRKKILFIVNVDWFFVSHRLPLALEALAKGYEVSIACAVTDKQEYLEEIGIRVYPLSISRSKKGLFGELQDFISIYKTLRQVAPDIVHFVTIKPVLYGGISTRFLPVIKKKVFSISGLGFVFIKEGSRAALIKKVVKFLYFIALHGEKSHVIVQNPDDKAVIQSICKVPITLIRGSGVDLEEYNCSDNSNENVTIVMACRLLRDKGVFEYVKAAEIVSKKNSNANFELYGDIDQDNPASLTEKDIKKIEADSIVKVYGFSKNISTVFERADIVVLPSYREGLPKVLIEAAACGRAVVTTDVPGCRDAIEVHKTGLLCKVKDAQDLAKKIKHLIINKELRKKMGKAGKELAQKEFDIKKVVDKHFEIYEDENE